MTRAELAFGALDRNKKGYITAKESLNISECSMLQHVLSCCRTWASWPRSCPRMRLPVCWQNLTLTVTVSSASRSSRCFLRRRTRGRRRVRRKAEKTWSDITQPRLVPSPVGRGLMSQQSLHQTNTSNLPICRIQFDIILNKLYLRLKRISASNPQMKRYFISICIWQFFQMYFLQYNWSQCVFCKVKSSKVVSGLL